MRPPPLPIAGLGENNLAEVPGSPDQRITVARVDLRHRGTASLTLRTEIVFRDE